MNGRNERQRNEHNEKRRAGNAHLYLLLLTNRSSLIGQLFCEPVNRLVVFILLL